jgi:hypothetical protein
MRFSDRFERAPRSDGWGHPWKNQRRGLPWGLAGGSGYYDLPVPQTGAGRNNPNPVFVVDHDVANVDMRARLSTTNAGARFGLLGRMARYSDFYAAYLDNDAAGGSRLRIGRFNIRTEIRLGSVPFPVEPNVSYWLRLRISGAGPVALAAKVWRAGEPEPARWTLRTTHSTYFISRAAPFGLLFLHDDTTRDSARIRVRSFGARSPEGPSQTPPRLTFAYAGRTTAGSRRGTHKTQVVARTDIPAEVEFRVSRDPRLRTFVTVPAAERFARAQTAKAHLDNLAPGNTYYWRAVATARSGRRQLSATRRLRIPATSEPISFAFGSCTHVVSLAESLATAARLRPGFFVHLGDFGYADRGGGGAAMAATTSSYQDRWTRMLARPQMEALHRAGSFIARQDDHDYGRNNCWRGNLRPFTKPAWDALSASATPERYFSMRWGDAEFFFLECHAYSDDPLASSGPDGTILGDTQKGWLEAAMRGSAASVLVVLSSLHFHAGGDGRATWKRRFATERSELLDLFFGLQRSGRPVIICSGNAHGQILNRFSREGDPDVHELVSSGTDQFEPDEFTPLPTDGIMMPDRALKGAHAFGFVTIERRGAAGRIRIRCVASKDPATDVWAPFSIDF